MTAITFDPANVQFSLANANSLALCANLAYEKDAAVTSTMAGYGYDAKFMDYDDVQFFVAHDDDAIIISIRGTTSIEDWMRDGDIKLQTVRPRMGKVHAGFMRCLNKIWDPLLAQVQAAQTKAQPIWITGHSLGAAIATLAMARFTLELDKPVNGVYTFGQPRVCDREFARIYNHECKSRHFRFVNNNDIVTRIPTREMCYSHVGTLRFFDADGTLHDDMSYWNQFLEAIKGTFTEQMGLIPAFAANHSMDKYETLVQNADQA